MNDGRILVATDFSSRSDRALRRALLLARDLGRPLALVHVVDDDQPDRVVKAERETAALLLHEQAQTLHRVDGVECLTRILEGDAHEAIADAATKLAAALVVVGPHRRRRFKDVFVGTTAERVIRTSRCPVLVADAVPAGSYRHLLLAVDLSPASADVIRAVETLGLARQAAITVVHAFDVFDDPRLARASFDPDSQQRFVDEARARAAHALDTFLAELGFEPAVRLVRLNDSSAGHVVCDTAVEVAADLIALGTHGRSGLDKLLLGSVAQEVLQVTTVDVLAVPPRRD
ncbi:MAG: universal stress protein [Gammaproteobacteria bacterium]